MKSNRRAAPWPPWMPLNGIVVRRYWGLNDETYSLFHRKSLRSKIPAWLLAKVLQYQIEIQYPYRSIIPDRRETASYILVLSIIPHPIISICKGNLCQNFDKSFGLLFGGTMDKTLMEYQRFCRAFIQVIFADSSKGVSPVICLQYQYFWGFQFFADTMQISVI